MMEVISAFQTDTGGFRNVGAFETLSVSQLIFVQMFVSASV